MDEPSKKPARPPGPPKEYLRPVERRVTRTLGDRLKHIREMTREGVRTERAALRLTGVAVLLIIASIASIYVEFPGLTRAPDPLADLRIEDFIRGKVTKLDDGRLELFYDFEPAPCPENLSEEEKQNFDVYPQLDDWAWEKGIDAYTGRLIGEATSRITFAGSVSVECDFEVLAGHSVEILIHYQIDGSYFVLTVTPGDKATLSYYKAGVHRPLSDGVKAGVVKRMVHHLRLDVTAARVRSFIDGKAVEDLPNPYPTHDWGAVRLKPWQALVAFDNVKITGRPDPEWIDAMLKIQKTLSGGGPAPAKPGPPKKLEPGEGGGEEGGGGDDAAPPPQPATPEPKGD